MGDNIILDNDATRNKQMINSMHNDIQCLSLDNAKRPCDRCWFTSKQIQEWSGMSKMTLDRRLEKLVSVGRIVGMKETTDDIIDIGTNKEIGSLNDDILQGDSTSNKFVTSENSNKNSSDIIEFLQKWKEITMWQNCHIVEMQNSLLPTLTV